MAEVTPPHGYVPAGPLESRPGGGFQPAEVRREALAAVLAGIPVGAYDERIVRWLTELDDDTCRTIASVMWRCRVAGVPGTETEWGIRRQGEDWVDQHETEGLARLYASADFAGETAVEVVRREVTQWVPAPEQESA